MPSFPSIRPISGVSSRPFSKFATQIAAMGTPKYPLHIGDTYLTPYVGSQLEKITVEKYPDAHKYTKPKGLPRLVKTISSVYETPEQRVFVTPGATGGLHIAAMTVLSPGDEVLILAPFWPLAAGIIRAVGAVPVYVPFFGEQTSVVERIQPYITSKTVAIYANTPNNPTGRMLSVEESKQLCQIAIDNKCWIFSDEVYEQLTFAHDHIPIRHYAPDNTISIFSFSKAYGMAGYRCGFVLLPNDSMGDSFLKMMVHSFYSVPTAAQYAADIVLKEGLEWIENTRVAYADIGYRCANILGVTKPQGGTFLFFDVSSRLNGRTMDDLLLQCIQQKLLLAPGSAFGGYDNHIRVCFTSVAPDVVLEAMDILGTILDG